MFRCTKSTQVRVWEECPRSEKEKERQAIYLIFNPRVVYSAKQKTPFGSLFPVLSRLASHVPSAFFLFFPTRVHTQAHHFGSTAKLFFIGIIVFCLLCLIKFRAIGCKRAEDITGIVRNRTVRQERRKSKGKSVSLPPHPLRNKPYR